ncbi:hypothetical protein BDF22DRAFT_691371 [Syncephalis plumigaleata]|nr:hypothetical protein BDF22DRAFT_691371 [Syncephalis plumigaleata]
MAQLTTETVVREVQNAQDYPRIFSLLTSVPANVFIGQCSAGDPLDLLNPKQHSLGYLYFLYECARLLGFVESFSREQVVLAPSKLHQLETIVAQWISRGLNPMFGIRVLTIAAQRPQPAPGYLTCLHASALKLALMKHRPHAVLSLLEQPITEIDGKVSSLIREKVEPFLLYYYYGGVIYALLKRYKEAELFFQQAITAPINTASAIQLAAYKKYMIISLISNGKQIPLPQYTSNVVLRTCRACASVYSEMVTFFDTQSINGLCEYINANKQILMDDGNYTLAQLLPDSLRNLIIQRMTKVNAKELQARITRNDTTGTVEGTVRFEGSVTPTGCLPPDIAQLMQHVATLSQVVRDTELKLTSSKEYLGRSMNPHMEDISMDEVDYMVGSLNSGIGTDEFY